MSLLKRSDPRLETVDTKIEMEVVKRVLQKISVVEAKEASPTFTEIVDTFVKHVKLRTCEQILVGVKKCSSEHVWVTQTDCFIFQKVIKGPKFIKQIHLLYAYLYTMFVNYPDQRLFPVDVCCDNVMGINQGVFPSPFYEPLDHFHFYGISDQGKLFSHTDAERFFNATNAMKNKRILASIVVDDICLALLPLGLPSYILLWIIEWLPEMTYRNHKPVLSHFTLVSRVIFLNEMLMKLIKHKRLWNDMKIAIKKN
jgi:hypothetical protein